MAGPRTIQRVPRGLLDALAMKGTGTSPNELGGVLTPIIDVSGLYLQDNFRAQNLTTAVVVAAGASSAVGSTVPPGEIWLMQHVACSSSLMGAGETYLDVRLCMNLNTYGCVLISPDAASASGVNERIGIGWDIPQFRALVPNDSFGIYVKSVTAGAHAFNVYASYYRLLI